MTPGKNLTPFSTWAGPNAPLQERQMNLPALPTKHKPLGKRIIKPKKNGAAGVKGPVAPGEMPMD